MELEETLENEINNGSRSHAYLLISQDADFLEVAVNSFIKKMKCLPEDVSIIRPAEETGKAGEIPVEQIRNLIHDISLTSHGKIRIAVIYQAEKLNISSASVLLKTLEEPPRNVVIILTALSDNILPTIKSRCRTLRFNRQVDEKSITFSYQDFLDNSLASSFSNIENIVKQNQIPILFTDLIAQFEKNLIDDKDSKAVIILEALLKAQKNIAKNANPRLTLENLILLIRETYER